MVRAVGLAGVGLAALLMGGAALAQVTATAAAPQATRTRDGRTTIYDAAFFAKYATADGL